jgi:hypothetical protein
LKDKVRAPVSITEIDGRGDPLCSLRDTPLPINVGTNCAERTVWFTCGLKATEFVFFIIIGVFLNVAQRRW